MKTFTIAAASVATLLFAATSTFAQSVFDGVWKTDMASAKLPTRPDVQIVKDGAYTCSSCVPPFTIKADGTFHAVEGHAGYDDAALRIVDAHTVEETSRKAGRVVEKQVVTVAADGKTVSILDTDTTNAGAPPVVAKVMETRVAAAPAGSHMASGSWQVTSVGAVSEAGLLTTFKLEGDMFKMSTPTGQSYVAKVDGGEAPFIGDPHIAYVTVKKVSDYEMIETDKRDGKVVSVVRMTVAPGGVVMTMVFDNKHLGTTTTLMANKV